jgi:hypothetical protein
MSPATASALEDLTIFFRRGDMDEKLFSDRIFPLPSGQWRTARRTR